jgi:hypothetical protein
VAIAANTWRCPTINVNERTLSEEDTTLDRPDHLGARLIQAAANAIEQVVRSVG